MMMARLIRPLRRHLESDVDSDTEEGIRKRLRLAYERPSSQFFTRLRVWLTGAATESPRKRRGGEVRLRQVSQEIRNLFLKSDLEEWQS